MNQPAGFRLNRRRVIQAALLGAAFPYTWAQDADATMYGSDLPRGPFGRESTAEEVTAGLDLTGMTAVVTGCNSGLGYETMRVLALRGAHVVGTARTAEKARQACDSVDGRTTPAVLELSDFASVEACAESIRALDIPIDMLICNAGIMALPELQLVYGLERQFVVNHLGHFLLVTRLLDAVSRAKQGRVVMVSSRAHLAAPPEGIDFDNLDGSLSYTPWEAYGRSKLANGLFAAELSRRMAGTRVTANSLHPGVIKTNLARYMNREIDDSRFDKTIPQGAATQCYVAAHPIPAPISGEYFDDCNPARASDLMYDKALAGRLWSVSEELIARHSG